MCLIRDNNLTEADIEEYLYFHLTNNIEQVIKNGLHTASKTARYYKQVYLGDYGRADVVQIDTKKKKNGKYVISVVVYELKRDNATIKDIEQITQYMGGIYHCIVELYTQKQLGLIEDIEISGCFIAPWIGSFVGFTDLSYFIITSDSFESSPKFEEVGYKYNDDNRPSKWLTHEIKRIANLENTNIQPITKTA